MLLYILSVPCWSLFSRGRESADPRSLGKPNRDPKIGTNLNQRRNGQGRLSNVYHWAGTMMLLRVCNAPGGDK
jgi:hypothetical protein